MGLDITAYRGLTLLPGAVTDNDGIPITANAVHVSPAILAWTEDNWPRRTAPLTAGVYKFAEADGFRAGPYSAYNRWRDWLAARAGYGSSRAVWDAKPAGPFVELIDFADNEGIIGTDACAKLARDFAEHEERILADADSWDAGLYRRWRDAFALAAQGGCVEFH